MAETQEQYKSRVLSYLAGRDPLPLLAAAPDALAALVAGLAEHILSHRPAPTKWSVREVVAHLADDELVGAYRIRLILSAPGTEIQAFDQDTWAATGRYGMTTVAASVSLFRALREANLSLVRAIRDEEWDSWGTHAERGRESIRDIVTYYAAHDLLHFAQLQAARDEAERHFAEKSVAR